MHKIDLYTDGACIGNPGAGGWGAILLCGALQKEFSGGAYNSTNNRMELSAVIGGLQQVRQQSEVTVYSDSAYVVNAFNQNWIADWMKNGWRTSGKKPVSNKDLWEELLALTNIHKVSFVKVKGHSDNKLNNRCDVLAQKAARRFMS